MSALNKTLIALAAAAGIILAAAVPTLIRDARAQNVGVTSMFFNDGVAGTVVQMKSTPGQILSMYVLNTLGATTYLQGFCKPSAAVTLGTTSADFTYRFPTNAGTAGPASVPFVFPGGLCTGGTGLSLAGTTTAGGNTGAALSISATFQ